MEVLEKILTPQTLLFLLQGAGISLALAAGALLIGVFIGIFGALGRISHNSFLRGVATVYVEFIRGTPMLLQITFLFIGLPVLVKAITGDPFSPNPFIVGLLAMGLNSGAYTTELIRSGIEGIDKGQMEAARSLGLTRWQAMIHVIMPQAFKRIIPPLVSEFIVLIKDSSLVSTIGVADLLRRSSILGAKYYNFAAPLLVVSVMYLCMTLTVSAIARRVERRLKVSD